MQEATAAGAAAGTPAPSGAQSAQSEPQTGVNSVHVPGELHTSPNRAQRRQAEKQARRGVPQRPPARVTLPKLAPRPQAKPSRPHGQQRGH
jgi:hypothetical protein